MFQWLTKDQNKFIMDMVNKNSEAWVESNFGSLSSKEKKSKVNELKILTYKSAQQVWDLDDECFNQREKHGNVTLLVRELRTFLDNFIESHTVSQMYLRNAANWFSYFTKKASQNSKVVQDFDSYLEVMSTNKIVDTPFFLNGPREG